MYIVFYEPQKGMITDVQAVLKVPERYDSNDNTDVHAVLGGLQKGMVPMVVCAVL